MLQLQDTEAKPASESLSQLHKNREALTEYFMSILEPRGDQPFPLSPVCQTFQPLQKRNSMDPPGVLGANTLALNTQQIGDFCS